MPASTLGPHGRLRVRLDALDELVAGVDVDAGVAVGERQRCCVRLLHIAIRDGNERPRRRRICGKICAREAAHRNLRRDMPVQREFYRNHGIRGFAGRTHETARARSRRARRRPTLDNFVAGRNAELVQQPAPARCGQRRRSASSTCGARPAAGAATCCRARSPRCAAPGLRAALCRLRAGRRAARRRSSASDCVALDDVDRLDPEAQVAAFHLYNALRERERRAGRRRRRAAGAARAARGPGDAARLGPRLPGARADRRGKGARRSPTTRAQRAASACRRRCAISC